MTNDKQKKILWVDEDLGIWEKEILALAGFEYQVERLGDACAARRFVFDNTDVILSDFRLIILDVMLRCGHDHDLNTWHNGRPEETGLCLAKALHARDPRLGSKILFFSAATDSNHVTKSKVTAREIGGHFLSKNHEHRDLRFVGALKALGLI